MKRSAKQVNAYTSSLRQRLVVGEGLEESVRESLGTRSRGQIQSLCKTDLTRDRTSGTAEAVLVKLIERFQEQKLYFIKTNPYLELRRSDEAGLCMQGLRRPQGGEHDSNLWPQTNLQGVSCFALPKARISIENVYSGTPY